MPLDNADRLTQLIQSAIVNFDYGSYGLETSVINAQDPNAQWPGALTASIINLIQNDTSNDGVIDPLSPDDSAAIG